MFSFNLGKMYQHGRVILQFWSLKSFCVMPSSIFFSDCDALCTFANSARWTLCVVLVSALRCVGPNCPLPCAIRSHSNFTYTLHYRQGLLDLKVKALSSFDISVTVYQSTAHNIPEDLHFLQCTETLVSP